jgi:hypothetical protein
MSSSSVAKKRKTLDGQATALSEDATAAAETFLRSIYPDHVATFNKTIDGLLRDGVFTTQFLIDLMGLPQDVSVSEISKKLFDPNYELEGYPDIDIDPWRNMKGARGAMYVIMNNRMNKPSSTPPEFFIKAKKKLAKPKLTGHVAFLLWPMVFVCKLADEEGLPGDVFGINHQELYELMHDITGRNTLGTIDDVFDVPKEDYVKFIRDMRMWQSDVISGGSLGMPPQSFWAFNKLTTETTSRLKQMAKTFLEKPMNDITRKERDILRDYRLLD